MAKSQCILAHVAIDFGSDAGSNRDEIKAAIRSAIQVGLNAKVRDLAIFHLADDEPQREVTSNPPPSSPSDRDQVIEEYAH